MPKSGSALLGALRPVFVLFLQKAGQLFSILVVDDDAPKPLDTSSCFAGDDAADDSAGDAGGVILSRMSSDGFTMQASDRRGGDAADDGFCYSRRNHRNFCSLKLTRGATPS